MLCYDFLSWQMTFLSTSPNGLYHDKKIPPWNQKGRKKSEFPKQVLTIIFPSHNRLRTSQATVYSFT